MPEPAGVFRGIQIKVIIGFALVLAAAIIAVVINFRALNLMSEAVSDLSRRDPKIERIRQMMADMNNEDIAARSFSLTGDTQYFVLFHQLNDSVHRHLALLRQLVRDNNAQLSLSDSITALVAEREAVLDAFIDRRRQSFLNERKPSIQSKEYEQESANAATVPALPPPSVTVPAEPVGTDSSAKATDGGFFSFNWAKNIFKAKDKKPKEKAVESATQSRADSVTMRPSMEISKERTVEAEDLSIAMPGDSVDWSVEELLLLQRNRDVMDRIRSFIAAIEVNESATRSDEAAEARAKASNANRIISMITLIGLVGALVFIGLILRDISISNRLRVQLEAERMRAEKLARAKQDFLASMSHEIRTPLNSIIGFSELLSKEEHSGKGIEYLTAIRKSSQHLLSLVNEILDFARLEEGKFKVQEAPFDFRELLKEIEKSFLVRAAEKQIQFSTSVDPSIPDLSGDAMSLRQILINLVNNAIKFTEKGSVSVNASLEHDRKNSCRVKIEVFDTGIGIAADVKEKLFTAFAQSSDENSRKLGGTGLGLAISKRLVEMMGGTIRAESEPGRGSVFILSIPFVKVKDELSGLLQTATEEPMKPVAWKGKYLLVADDEEMNIKLCVAMLSPYGVQITPAFNGKEALEKISNGHFDLVLMDLQMPEMDGIEATKQIRALREEEKRKIPVVSLSANVFGSKSEQYVSAGFSGELIKPFRESELISILETYLGVPATTVKSLEHELKTDGSELYSLKYLQSTSGNDQGFVKGMLGSFVQKTSDQVAGMQEASRTGDFKSIQELAHKMIPSLRYLCMTAAEEKMRRIEGLAAAGTSSTELSSLIEQISEDVSQVIPLLQEEMVKLESR